MRPSLEQAPPLILLGGSVLAGVAWWLQTLKRRGAQSVVRRLCAALFALWVVGVLVVVLPGISPSLGPRTVGLVPFSGVDRTATETWGNVAMFVPAGVLSALATDRAGAWRRVLAGSLVVSLFVETYQYVDNQGRSSDSTDVVLNVAGALVGYLLSRALQARTAPSTARQADPRAAHLPQ